MSGDRIVYLDPQEQVWPGDPGQCYSLSSVIGTDMLVPFNGIANFDCHKTTNYLKTLFRFPLREKESRLSDSTYTPEALSNLIGDLKEEAKYLLIFLRSVHTVEVYDIPQLEKNKCDLIFQVTVAPKSRQSLIRKREAFLATLKQEYRLKSFKISKCITDVARFDVIIIDRTAREQLATEQSVSWLVASQVGSSNTKVLDAAAKQRVFPWVGVAIELDTPTSSAQDVISGGRIFCFLPMPAETLSKLPVHVNGTFGLNDDRRTLKWPAKERRDDPTALWNLMLVRYCLPSCYDLLLLAAKEIRVSPDNFYRAWPLVEQLKSSHWSLLLDPLMSKLREWECLWAKNCQKWVSIRQAYVVPRHERLAEVILRVLTRLGLPLCDVPDHVVEALEPHAQQVSPTLVCRLICEQLKSYQNEHYKDKLALLHYCLMEENFVNYSTLELLPMADHTFKTFCNTTSYLCSEEFPRELLPNLEHKLVDVWGADWDLHEKLKALASKGSKNVKLKSLSTSVVANLLSKCYPHSWEGKKIVQVSRNDTSFPFDWCETFWKWVQNHDLSLFLEKLTVPITLVDTDDCHTMNLTRLTAKSAVVLIKSDSFSRTLVEAFSKLGIYCTMLKHVPYLQHHQSSCFFNSCDPSGVLTAVSNSECSTDDVIFSSSEALELQSFLASQRFKFNELQVNTLARLGIFHVINHSSPVSLLEASKASFKKKVILPPYDFCFTAESLPPNIVVLSSGDNSRSLLDACDTLVSKPDSLMNFLLEILFPMIQKNYICQEDKVDKLMVKVLEHFTVLRKDERAQHFKSVVTHLRFIKVEDHSLGRKAPGELYDCSSCLLKDLFLGQPVFPHSPFDVEDMIVPLRECGLQTHVSGQKLLSIINDYACAFSKTPQKTTKEKMRHANSVLAYISEHPCVLNESVRIIQNTSYPLCVVLAKSRVGRNWLPVMVSPPNDYPPCLTWKSERYASHLVSHKESVAVCKAHDFARLSSIVGSEMYIVQCPDVLVETLGCEISVDSVLQHFIHVVKYQQQIVDKSYLNSLVDNVYEFLNNNLDELRLNHPTSTLRHKKLIWIKKWQKFVSPDLFVLNNHPSFQYNLSPFYQPLPESLSEYSELFIHFGVRRELSTSDIVQILGKIKDDNCGEVISDSLAWDMCTNILSWLTNHGQKHSKEKITDADIVYVPIESNSPSACRPQLVDVKCVVYTDMDFLRSFEASKGDAIFIHERFIHLAPLLGVKRLSAHWDISHDAFGDVGPHEPLVTRLKSILKDYKDGLTIIKELIQNADDANATEVNICYDGRMHSIEQSSLLFRGMARCHGPALIVHNNSTFSDEDFVNITKLAGATKQQKPLKIGQFGVGFCSVYHITDIPSFVSGEWLYVFDPAILFLANEIHNQAKPGKKLKFTEKLVHFSKQLDPYKGLFGFRQDESYQGTIFRFPFRTYQSDQSISDIVYKEMHIHKLREDIQNAGSKLLLFLNNVKRIRFSWIDNQSSDAKPKILLSLDKKTKTIISPRCEIQQVTIGTCQATSTTERCEYWLTARERKELNYCNIESKVTKKTGIASVSCRLLSSPHYLPKKIEGEMFCFLPLSLQTGLPVHVSANFAVLSDRNGIHTSDSDSPNEEVKWNFELCKTLIPKAYYSMLNALYQLCQRNLVCEDEYKFYHLWPLKNELKTHVPWEHAVHSLYRHIASGNEGLFFSHCTSRWYHLHQSRILSSDILLSDQIDLAKDSITAVVKELCIPVIDIPDHYLEYFANHVINSRIIHESEFIDLFFGKIHQISTEVRNDIIFHVLRVYTIKGSGRSLTKYLSQDPCVPCTPDGTYLRKCSEVIDPCACFAKLYDNNDGVFPIERFHRDKVIHITLLQLGIIQRYLPWHMIVQRVKTIPLLYSVKESRLKVLQRTSIIVTCIGDQLNMSKHSQIPASDVDQLTTVSFVPVMKRPKDYPKSLKWFGDDHDLCSCQNLLQGNKSTKLAGSQMCVMNESEPEDGGCGAVPQVVAKALGIGQEPSCEIVVKHLLQIVDNCNTDEELTRSWVNSACVEIYDYLNMMLSQQHVSADDLKKIVKSKSIWTGQRFVSSSSIARSWNHSGPYLYCIPSTLASREKLIEALEIQSKFTLDHFLSALEEMHKDFSGEAVHDQDVFKTITGISSELMARISNNITVTLSEHQVCFLPGVDRIMRKTSELALNDAQWLPMVNEGSFHVHQIIHPRVATQLGVTSAREKVLKCYDKDILRLEVDGKPFGQHEDIKQRIRNILYEYPKDITVLKELIQNADDAKATKVHFILDKRHHGKKRMISTEWEDLQGPALLVWNDSGMSDEDLKGIQKLGIGGKHFSDEDTIGQYGIGFNVVYHLTDCPSFLTKNGSKFCVLDPHCRYVPCADERRPGRLFDGIDEQFWSGFSDMKTTYLCDSDEYFKSGTLFRFPLRHNNKLVTKSELIKTDSTTKFASSGKQISARQMEQDLEEWTPKIKETLLFLNNVKEIKVLVIEKDNSTLNLMHHYKILLSQTAIKMHDQILHKVCNFSVDKSSSDIARYQVTLSELAPTEVQEEWLIQEGVGDISDEQQSWQFLPKSKPRHGLATKLNSHTTFEAKVFCFLPLPLQARLPVHINGNFALDSARSGLWQPRDISKPDDRKKWNLNLVEAIASSYASFLVTHREHFASSEFCVSAKQTQDAVKNYYNLFPLWRVKSKPEGEMLTLAQCVFKKLTENNSPILAVITENSTTSEPSMHSIQWRCIIDKDEPYNQVYFWKTMSNKSDEKLPPVLKKLGIKITAAPMVIQQHFKDIEVPLPLATPEQMFDYYCTYHTHIIDGGPCPITKTRFESVTNFIKFVQYVVQEKHFEDIAGTYFMFPKSPLGIPLLLSADEILHPFSNTGRVISSKFSHLFQKSYDRFVHPEVFKLSLVPEYFMKPSDGNWEMISGILKDNLPECLRNERISSASKNVSIRDVLIPLWQCFHNEKIFQIHLKEILNKWALMLSTSNELFSCRSVDQLVPIIPPEKVTIPHTPVVAQSATDALNSLKSRQQNEEIFQILKKSGMPVLDTEVVNVSLGSQFCPHLNQPAKILQNLHALHQLGELQLQTSDKSFDIKVSKLLTYFSSVNFYRDRSSLDKIKSLPFFKTVDCSYHSIVGKAYVWPGHVCLSGRNNWMENLPVVFLKSDGAWCKLGPAESLGIDVISHLSLYTQFIFPHFHLLSKADKLKQLKHIRDTPKVFDAAYHDSKAEDDSDRKKEALNFVQGLKHLPCILKDGDFRMASTFCDSCVQLFKEFANSYEFPPRDFSDEKWLEFFRKIGLKVDVSQDEFLTLCEKVANGCHKTPSKASQTLLKYLFDYHDWHKDTNFLDAVSKVPFVHAQSPRNLTFIAPAAKSKKVVRQAKEAVRLTSLDEAASNDNICLIWTVMPVVRLPRLFYNFDNVRPWELQRMKDKFYNDLHICRIPQCIEVVDNLLNISRSDFSKFDTRSEDHHETLLEVITECFDYLCQHSCSKEDLSALIGAPCIPVTITDKDSVIHCPVLVPPCQVIADNGDAIIMELVPFLIPLPDSLYSALPTVLSAIGVSQKIQFDNIRHALQLMHSHAQPQTKLGIAEVEIVKKLIKHLYFWLCRSDSACPDDGVTLYLPSCNGDLVESRQLIYNDNEHYEHANLSCKFLSLLVDEHHERIEYGFTLKDLYSKLPTKVRPPALSHCCIEQLSDSCKQNEQLTDFAGKIKQALSRPNFAHIAVQIIQARSPTSANMCGKFEPALAAFHRSVTIHSICDLKTDVLLKPAIHIGDAKVNFLLESNQDSNSYLLYIDSDVDALTWEIFESLSANIVSTVACMSEIDLPDFIPYAKEAITCLLKGPRPDQLRKHLNKLGINTIGLDLQVQSGIDCDFTPQLGQPIPSEMFHRLYCDIDNTFKTDEWVAYEDKENHFIFARVEYHAETFHDTQEEHGSDNYNTGEEFEFDHYEITISEEIVKVSVVELYKILPIRKETNADGIIELVINYPKCKEALQWENIKDCNASLVSICQWLKNIWRITENDKKQKIKAVCAMYLKCHPDKQPNPLMPKEPFQFFKDQIKRLEQGIPVEKPDLSVRRQDVPISHFWDRKFQELDDLVQLKSGLWQHEKKKISLGLPHQNIDDVMKLYQGQPDPEKAKFWLQQAKYDLDALHVLNVNRSSSKLNAHVCFMAHQVAEKALKAGMLQLVGRSESHNLVDLARKVEDNYADHGLEKAAESFKDYYLDTRYPDRWYRTENPVPADNFTPAQADEAKNNAEKILRTIEQLHRQAN